MEFFLQTLVKKRIMHQHTMLSINQLLMLGATSAAVRVLGRVRWPMALASLALNFLYRHHELFNFACTHAMGALLFLCLYARI